MKRILTLNGLWVILAMVIYVPVRAHAPKAFSQEITLLEAIEEISKKYDVYFTFDMTLVSDIKVNYTKDGHNSADEAISRILKGTELAYKFYDQRFVIIYKNDAEGLESLKKMAHHIDDLISDGEKAKKNRRAKLVEKLSNESTPLLLKRMELIVEGQVVDHTGEPLIGVNVLVKGTSNGTATDFNGNFSLQDVNENAVLLFSYIGYQSQEVVLNGRSNLNVTLIEDSQTLDEIVVVGYGNKKKIHLTGAVDQVNSEELENRPVGSMSQALQGLVPNLSVTTTNGGGEPGSSRNLNIRGVGSLAGDNSPYILVDGVPMDLESVNPDDIENVSVLKDAAASAIYGARGAFGVILITTKSGSQMNNETTIEYSGLTAWGAATVLPKSQTGLESALVSNLSAQNSGQSVPYNEQYMERVNQYASGQITDETWGENNVWVYPGNASNDWPEIFYGGWAPSQKHNINLSGNRDKTNFYLSGGYFSQDGQLNFGEDNYTRYNFLSNIKTEITDWLKVDANVKYTNSNTSYPLAYDNYDRTVNWHNMTRYPPLYSLYFPYGGLNGNVGILESGGRDLTNNNDLWLGIGATIEPIKGWQTRLSFNNNHMSSENNQHRKTIFIETPDGNSQFSAYAPPNNGVIKNYGNFNYQIFNAISSYEKDINDHNFMVLVGYEQQMSKLGEVEVSKFGLITDEVPSISTATGNTNVDDNLQHWSSQGVFSRVNYNYQDKYLVEVNARYDGSSKFNGGEKWGVFPSASVGYNISRENFWSDLENTINSLKFRASYGSLGNQGRANEFNYQYIPIIPVQTNLGWIFDGQRPNYTNAPQLVSNNLTWETVTTLNFGTDASFMDNKLNITYDWYIRNTTDGHGPAEALPSALGTSPPQKNNTELETKGFEFILSWRDGIGSDLFYDVKLMLSNSKSTVTSYNNPTGILTTYRNGQVLGELWGYSSAGFYETENEEWADQSFIYPNWGPGDMKYQDLNEDGKIDIGNNTFENSGDQSIIGNSTPQYSFGVNGGITWKGLSLSMFWQGVGKRDIIFNSDANVFYGFRGSFQQNSYYKEHLDFWSPEGSSIGGGTDAYYPKPYYDSEHLKNTQPQTKYMQNAAYIRLKNIQIGYVVPSLLTEKVFIKKARIYFSGENLYTITKLSKLFDPEALGGDFGSGKIYPLQKVLSVGLNITI